LKKGTRRARLSNTAATSQAYSAGDTWLTRRSTLLPGRLATRIGGGALEKHGRGWRGTARCRFKRYADAPEVAGIGRNQLETGAIGGGEEGAARRRWCGIVDEKPELVCLVRSRGRQ